MRALSPQHHPQLLSQAIHQLVQRDLIREVLLKQIARGYHEIPIVPPRPGIAQACLLRLQDVSLRFVQLRICGIHPAVLLPAQSTHLFLRVIRNIVLQHSGIPWRQMDRCSLRIQRSQKQQLLAQQDTFLHRPKQLSIPRGRTLLRHRERCHQNPLSSQLHYYALNFPPLFLFQTGAVLFIRPSGVPRSGIPVPLSQIYHPIPPRAMPSKSKVFLRIFPARPQRLTFNTKTLQNRP